MSSAIFEKLDWFITYVCVNLFMDNYLEIRFSVIWYVFLYELELGFMMEMEMMRYGLMCMIRVWFHENNNNFK